MHSVAAGCAIQYSHVSATCGIEGLRGVYEHSTPASMPCVQNAVPESPGTL